MTSREDPVPFPVTRGKIVNFCNQEGYDDNGNTGSVRDYFYDQSLGAVTYTQNVTPIVTLNHPRNYYNYDNYPTNTSLRDAGEAGRARRGPGRRQARPQAHTENALLPASDAVRQ